MRAPASLSLDYVSSADAQASWDEVLGVASFHGTPAGAARAAGIPIAPVNMPVLPGNTPLCEIWSCGEPATSGQHGSIQFRRTQELLFGSIAVAESDFEGRDSRPDVAGSALHQATAEVYLQVYRTLEAQGYPHLLRVWNYLPDINRDSQGSERYWQFNTARQHALQECGRALAGNVPAASALGASGSSPLVVYFLAGRVAPTFIENPRQLSAYRYPREYGTHSPVFSRAALLRQAAGLTLFISGTASIVGHRSLHAGDTAAQARETLTNIEALLSEANRVAADADFGLEALAYKVYVRHPAELPLIQATLTSQLGSAAKLIYLQAEICRQDLLVEIEATGVYPLAT